MPIVIKSDAEIAAIAPDVFWLQLYRFSRDNHKIGLDLVRRAAAVGVKTLTLTLDVPVRTTRWTLRPCASRSTGFRIWRQSAETAVGAAPSPR